LLPCHDTSGSGTVQSCTTKPIFTPASNSQIIYSTTTPNAGDVTVNVNGLGAKHVRKWLGYSVLDPGDLPANTPVLLIYDGTYWELQTIGNNPTVTGCGPATTGTLGCVLAQNSVEVFTSSHSIQASENGAWIVMNCSSSCVATLPATPPLVGATSAWGVSIISPGSALATLSLNGNNFNGNATAPALSSTQPAWIQSDGTTYWGHGPATDSANSSTSPSGSPPNGGGSVYLTSPVTIASGDTATLFTFPNLRPQQYFIDCPLFLDESTTSTVPEIGITYPGATTYVGVFWTVLTGSPPIATQASVCPGGGFLCGGTYPVANFNYGPNLLGGTFTLNTGGTLTITGSSSGGGSTTFSSTQPCKVFH